ncbi:MAG: hypothetical protein M1820_003822 [Bogoriella megaspora]|nr:MAG: hypothetical protein M1820_003822 [Bogoriella megaspora]
MAAQTYDLWIGGTETPGSGKNCDSATLEDVDGAVRVAYETYKSGVWSDASCRHFRADVLDKIAEVLQKNIERLIKLEVQQTGRPHREMKAQVPSLVKWFKYFASILRTEERSVLPTSGKLHNWVDRVPLGVVAQITPFNHPLLIATKKIAPALAGGNSIVLKPSELTPISSLLIGELFKNAGLPDGVFNVVNGDGATTGKALAEHPLVAKIDITGSTSAGRALGAIAGQKLNSFTAELGGKAPLIVFEQADLDLAVNGIAFASFIATGQTCIAATRILVQNSVIQDLIPKLKVKCESIVRRMGKPTSAECAMGPLVSERQLDKVIDIVNEAVAHGATVQCGGYRLTGRSTIDDHDFSRGYYYPPTVLTDGSGARIIDTKLWREEVFGPVIVVVGFDTEDEAIKLANDSEFGLGAALWTTDLSQAYRVSQRIEAGIVWDAYHSYTKMKSTIINYATTEESLQADDWFREDAGEVRYN